MQNSKGLPDGYIWVRSKNDLPPEAEFKYWTDEELRSSLDTFKPYPCEVCHQGFLFGRLRDIHVLREHLCEVCQTNVPNLKRHLEKGHRKCPHCEVLIYRTWFKSHVLSTHGEQAWEELKAKGSAQQAKALPPRAKAPPPRAKVLPPRKMVECPICHRRVKTPEGLSQHARDVHRKR